MNKNHLGYRYAMGFLMLFCLAAGSAWGQSGQDLPAEVIAYADIIVFNGKILVVDDQFSTAEALAIREELILAVGDSAKILKMAGPQTEKIDLGGRTVIPGLIDTHYHLGDYAMQYMLLEEKGINWEGKVEKLGLIWEDLDVAFRDIKRAIEAADPDELVRVPTRNGSLLEGLTLKELDSFSPENPVVVVDWSQFTPIAVNTKAIEWASIPTGTPGLPIHGGVMITGRANRLLAEYLTWAIPMETVIPWHKKTMKLVNSWGLTMAVTRIRPDQFNALREIWLQEGLTVRWRVGFPGPLNIPHTGNVSDIGDDWLRISGAGGGMAVPGAEGAAGHWSSKVSPTSAEPSGWSRRRSQMLEALSYGWSIPNSHIKGNIAVHEVLNVIEEAQLNSVVKSSNQRFTMDHMMEIDDADIPRIKKLGVIPSNMMRDVFSDEHIDGASRYTAIFGADYVNNWFPLKKYLDANIQPTLEGDVGDEMLGKPLWTIEKAVCRCVDGSPRVWGREHKVTRENALRMKTIWAAYYVGDEKTLGSLEPGKLADLVVLNGDYMTVEEEQISDLEVVITIVGGKVVYSLEGTRQ